jgi:hypothetical protein
VDINAKDNKEWTALMRAARTTAFEYYPTDNTLEICKLLISAIVGQSLEEQKSAAKTLFGILKKKWHGKDMPIKITQELKAEQRQKYQENKAQALTQILKIENQVLKQELLDYLNSL